MHIKEKKKIFFTAFQTLHKSSHRTTLRILSCKFGYQLTLIRIIYYLNSTHSYSVDQEVHIYIQLSYWKQSLLIFLK